MVYIDLLVDIDFIEEYSAALYIPGRPELFPQFKRWAGLLSIFPAKKSGFRTNVLYWYQTRIYLLTDISLYDRKPDSKKRRVI